MEAERDAWLRETSRDVEQFRHYPAHVAAFGNYRIDWILFRGPFVCRSAEVDTRTYGGVVASDHFPVSATLEWRDNVTV